MPREPPTSNEAGRKESEGVADCVRVVAICAEHAEGNASTFTIQVTPVNIVEQIELEAEGCDIVGIVVSPWAHHDFPSDLSHRVITWSEAKPLLEKLPKPMPSVYAWTADDVIFVSENEEGDTWITSIPRNPCDGHAEAQ